MFLRLVQHAFEPVLPVVAAPIDAGGSDGVVKYLWSAFNPRQRLKHMINMSMAKGRATMRVMVCRVGSPPKRKRTMAADINSPHITAHSAGRSGFVTGGDVVEDVNARVGGGDEEEGDHHKADKPCEGWQGRYSRKRKRSFSGVPVNRPMRLLRCGR